MVIRGARQVGKTYLVEQFAREHFQTALRRVGARPRGVTGLCGVRAGGPNMPTAVPTDSLSSYASPRLLLHQFHTA